MVFALALVSGAHAADITFAFDGEVSDYVSASASTMAALPLGASVAGTYTFDSATPDTDPSNTSNGDYDDAITALSVSVAGGATVSLDLGGPANFILVDDGSVDAYFVSASVSGMIAPGIDATLFSLQLVPGAPTAFSSDALPLTPPSLGDFPGTFESILFVLNETEAVEFTVSSLRLVPEPTTLILCGIGLVSCIGRGRRS